MKALLLALLLWQAADEIPGPHAEQRFLRYQRTITLPTTSATAGASTCATLDASVYAHAAPNLKDVRLYDGSHEAPYAITLSESAETDSEPARILNAGMRSGRIVFDIAMPPRPYTDVILDLDAHNFIASAEVSGATPAGTAPIRLGTFTLFDLSAQHLSRNTTLHLQESSFQLLHVELAISDAPGATGPGATAAMVTGASVPPNREAQTLFTPVAETATLVERNRQTVATLLLPAHVPVERVSFDIAPDFTGNFSRTVSVVGHAKITADTAPETLSGDILRIHLNEAGHELRQEELHIPATLGVNLQTDATVDVLVDNGDDAPLPITAVRLEMRQRRLCFAAPAARELTLDYGDPALAAPSYDYARLFSPAGTIVTAQLGREQQNAAFTVRPEALRPLTDRHPELLWIVLLAVVCVLAVVALHSAKRMPK